MVKDPSGKSTASNGWWEQFIQQSIPWPHLRRETMVCHTGSTTRAVISSDTASPFPSVFSVNTTFSLSLCCMGKIINRVFYLLKCIYKNEMKKKFKKLKDNGFDNKKYHYLKHGQGNT